MNDLTDPTTGIDSGLNSDSSNILVVPRPSKPDAPIYKVVEPDENERRSFYKPSLLPK
jgi:hypothetical protein